MPHAITSKSVNGRLVYTGAATTATDNTTAITSNIIDVPAGQSVTMIYAVTTVTAGNKFHKAMLQGSLNRTNWVTLQTITCDADLSGADLAAAGSVAKTHTPSSAGDYPYYRISTVAEGAADGHVGTVSLIIN